VPVLAAALIVGTAEKPRLLRVLASAVVFPLLCLVGSWAYYDFAFSLAARTVYWLNPADVMRAANGPAYVTFKYVAKPFTPMSFPVPAEQLSSSDLDLMRLHVASACMNSRNQAWVLKEAYPHSRCLESPGARGRGDFRRSEQGHVGHARAPSAHH
jgi:hypothetical protein